MIQPGTLCWVVNMPKGYEALNWTIVTVSGPGQIARPEDSLHSSGGELCYPIKEHQRCPCCNQTIMGFPAKHLRPISDPIPTDEVKKDDLISA